MADDVKPWERYQANEHLAVPANPMAVQKPVDGPWTKYATKPDASAEPWWSDLMKSIGSGLVEGGYDVAALPGNTMELAHTLGSSAGNLLRRAAGKSPLSPDQQPDPLGLKTFRKNVLPTSEDLEGRTGFTPYAPQTEIGKLAHAGAEFVPGAVALGGAGTLREALAAGTRYGVAPGVASEAAGEATKGTAAEPWARLAGAIVGGGAPARVVTPFPSSAERQAAVQALRGEGVTDLTAGQVTGARGLKYTESEMGGGRMARTLQNQGDQFTAAALRHVGENANRATPEMINRAFTRIGGDFDRLAANNTLHYDPQFNNDLLNTQLEYENLVPPSQRTPAVENLINDIGAHMRSSPQGMSGEVYQTMRSRVDRLARGARADPQLSDALFGIRNSLDDAMGRSLPPADRVAWAQARRQYRNMLVIENTMAGANAEDAMEGVINPARLKMAVTRQNKRDYVRGHGDFADLAHSGAGVMGKMPDSGTASRSAARVIPGMLGGALAHALSGGAPEIDALGASAAAIMAPYATGRAILSRPGRAYLGNQLIPRGTNARRMAMALMYADQPETRRSIVRPLQAPDRLLPAPQ